MGRAWTESKFAGLESEADVSLFSSQKQWQHGLTLLRCSSTKGPSKGHASWVSRPIRCLVGLSEAPSIEKMVGRELAPTKNDTHVTIDQTDND